MSWGTIKEDSMPKEEKTSKDVASIVSKLVRREISSQDVKTVDEPTLNQAANKPKPTRGQKRRKKK
jgi:hypothetical protein